MTEILYKTLLSISGSVILLLIGILGYFLKQNIAVLKNVTEALQSFREDYIQTKEKVSNMQEGCKDRHKIIDHRLNSHAKRLDQHEKDIAVLQV